MAGNTSAVMALSLANKFTVAELQVGVFISNTENFLLDIQINF